MRTYRSHNGFTITELAVVLVIIGLIVGGILVGRSLIGTAGAQAVISEVKKHMEAINMFRDKYNCLPGDCINAQQFLGMTFEGRNIVNGNGNKRIEWPEPVGAMPPRLEGVQAWFHLRATQMIEGFFAGATSTNLMWMWEVGIVNTDTTNGNIPASKIGSAGYYIDSDDANIPAAFSQMRDYLVLGPSQCEPREWVNPSLSVDEAYTIDRKMDDGLPNTGRVINAEAINPVAMPIWTLGGWDPNCVAMAAYNLANKNGRQCVLLFGFRE